MTQQNSSLKFKSHETTYSGDDDDSTVSDLNSKKNEMKPI